jgi:hypothetical protein
MAGIVQILCTLVRDSSATPEIHVSLGTENAGHLLGYLQSNPLDVVTLGRALIAEIDNRPEVRAIVITGPGLTPMTFQNNPGN